MALARRDLSLSKRGGGRRKAEDPLDEDIGRFAEETKESRAFKRQLRREGVKLSLD